MTDFTELDQKKPYGYIYKIDFPQNGKVYIGLTTTSLEQRKKEHKKCVNAGDTRYLYNALRKYNMVDTLELIVIDTADTLEELREKEIMYIFEYNSHYIYGYGYNMTYGGEGVNGYHYTEEVRKKMSQAGKERFKRPGEIEKNRQRGLERFKRPGARKEHSEKIKSSFENNPQLKENCSKAQKKRFKNNPEAGKQHGEKMKAHYENNEEAREKAREKAIEQFKNPEAREKASKAQKIRYENNPNAGKQHGEKMKAHFKNNPNAGKEQGERIRVYHEKNPEARKRAREKALKQFKNPEAKKKILDAKGKNKPFDVLTKDGTIIKTFTYQMEAREYLIKEHNITSTIKISQVLNGKRNHSAGFVFKYKD